MGFDKIQPIYNGCFQLQLYLVFLVCIFFVLLRDADPTKVARQRSYKAFCAANGVEGKWDYGEKEGLAIQYCPKGLVYFASKLILPRGFPFQGTSVLTPFLRGFYCKLITIEKHF